MNCPKCGFEIDENTKVCPNCKKVLLLECPICHTVNKSSTCSLCGYTILSKCHKCGKINPTNIKKCPKCGTSTYLSVALSESNINEFACVTFDFPNVSSMQKVFNSQPAYHKFRQNLLDLLTNFLTQNGLKWQIINRGFVVKFNKDTSLASSTYNALNMVFDFLKLIMKLNVKLDKAYKSLIRCHVAILKKDVNTEYNDFKSDFNIRMMYKDVKQDKFYNAVQVIADGAISDILADKVKLTSLGTVINKENRLESYSELDIEKYVQIPRLGEKSDKEKLINQLKQISIEELESKDDEEEGEVLNNIKKLNFDEQVCEFTTIESDLLAAKIVDRLQKFDKNIISIKTKKKYYQTSSEIINLIKLNKAAENVVKITCTDDMKNRPYAFFYEMLGELCDFATSAKFFAKNDFSFCDEHDKTGSIKALINYQPNKEAYPENTRDVLFNLFALILSSMKDYLIFVEDFEKIDTTSFEILQLIFRNFNKYDLNLVLFSNENFSLHKNSHFLLANVSYCELCVKAASFDNLVANNIQRYSEILDTFYMKKIVQYTKGSALYLKHAINYLIESEILVEKAGSLVVEKNDSIVLASTLEKLIESRFRHLYGFKEVFRVFALMLYIGQRVDFMTLQALQIPNMGDALAYLDKAGYIYMQNNYVYFNNYNILKNVMNDFLDKSEKVPYAKHLLATIVDEKVPLPVNLKVYEVLDKDDLYCKTWQDLADVNLLLGDFNAYLNCSMIYLKLIEHDKYRNNPQSIAMCKQIIYDNLASMLYKFVPTKIYSLSKMILENIEQSIDKEKIVPIYSKMLQCCLNTGNYTQASILSNKILMNLQGKTYNPMSENFSQIVFWISLIKINLYFNTGELKKCIELGEKLLKQFSLENIKNFSQEEISHEQMLDLVYESLGYVLISKAIELENVEEFLQAISQVWGELPKSYDMFIYLQKFIQGQLYDIDVDYNDLNNMNKFGLYIYNVLKAFENIEYDINLFAKRIYHAKLVAKEHNLTQLDLISDMLIGYSYRILTEYEKANKIYQNVKETSVQSGLVNVNILSWYFIAELKYIKEDYDSGVEICKNTIALLEKNQNSNEILLLLFYVLIVRLLKKKDENENADTYLNQAEILIEKNNLNRKQYIVNV